MIEVTRYVASDGKEFDKREDCIEYENATELHEAIKKISEHCGKTWCEDCPFSKSKGGEQCLFELIPSNWKDYL